MRIIITHPLQYLEKVPTSLRENLEKGAQKLTVTKDAIKKETKKKIAIETKRVETKHQLKQSSQQLKQLSKERENTKRELEEKQEELDFLRRQEEQQRGNDFLMSIIADKEVEISRLEQEATRVERELSQARDDHVSLATKHVEELSEEREKIKKDMDKKEMEHGFLRQQEQSQKNNTRLKATIERKEAEIHRLCSHMIGIVNDFSVVRKEHEELRQNLRQTTAKLAVQSELVRELDRTRVDLESERNIVDTKLKMEIAKSEVCCVGLHLN